MQRKIATAALFLSAGITGQAFAGGFDVKTSQGTLPKKESKRPLSLPRALLKLDISTSYMHGITGFNNNGLNGCDPVLGEGCEGSPGETSSFMLYIPGGDVNAGSLAHNFVDIQTHKLDVGYGLTENWTVGFVFPFITAQEDYAATANNQTQVDLDKFNGTIPVRNTNALGDMNFSIQYQFLRTFEGPMRALVGRINMKLPTGNESPGDPNKVIAGDNPDTPQVETQFASDTRALLTSTGSTDAELSVVYKQELAENFAVTAGAGYVVRFPTITGFMFDDAGVQFADGLKGSARMDLGDQVYGNIKLAVSPADAWYATLDTRLTRWGATRVARPTILGAQQVATNEQTTEEQDVFIGGNFLEIPESAGFLVTTTPRFTYQPKDWLEVGLGADLHLVGKNTNYVRGNNVTDQRDAQGNPIDRPFGLIAEEENNFFINETLGTPLGPIILGATKLTFTVKY
jgi:hypothetical protein